MTKFRKYLVAIFATLLAVAASAADVPYGTNLLQNTNPDGTTFDPWSKTDGGSGWAISDGKFCSAHIECVLTQTVNLKDLGLTTEQTDSLTMLSMVNYEIPWPGGNACIAKVIITCKDSDGNNLSEQSLLDINQSNLEVSATLATKLFLLPKGTTQLVYEVHGKAQKNWGGQYGPRFWSMYVGFSGDLTKTYTASAVASLGDSLVLSKTDGIKILDTVTVTSKYSDVRVKSISSENSSVISSNQAMCIGTDMTINAEFYRKHSIVASSSEYGTITFKKDAAICGDTITVSHTMNSYTVRFAGYTTTPDLNWLTDSTFVMVDEDVTIGMHARSLFGMNLLQNTNPDGTTFDPWVKANGGSGWAILDGKFCSSYSECVLTQTVNLKDLGLTTEQTDSLTMLSMVNYEIPWPGGDKCIAKVIITCKDSDGNNLSEQSLLDINQSNLEVSATLATKPFLLPEGTTQLVYEMHGQDQKSWGGQYGPRFWDMYIGFIDLTKTYTASAVAALGDSLVFSQTDGIKALDTLTVASKYSDVRIKSISSENSDVISSNQAMCIGSDMTINAEFYRKHSIVASSEFGTIAFKKNTALCGDTIIVSHTMNSDTVRFAGYTTTPNLNWLTDSTFIMVDEDVSIGMEVYRKHRIVASSSEYGTIEIRKATAICGDTVTVSYTMNSDAVCFAGYTTTPDLNWLTDSTFVMVDEDVTIGMHAWSLYGTNLLQNTNPDGTTFAPWVKTDAGSGWAISDGKFCSSNEECVLTQTVNLKDLGLTTEQTDSLTMLSMVNYEIPWPGNYKCIAKVVITCKDSDGNNLSEQSLLDINQSNIEVSATSATKSFLLPKGTTQLVYEVHGKSQKNWGGQYGPRFWSMYVGFVEDLKKTYTASAVAALGDSLVLSKTDGIKILDTVTVTSKYSDVRVKSISSENSSVISSNQAMCIGANMTINAEFYRKHSIVASSSEYGTIEIRKATALCGDTITVSHTMNTDTVRFAGYTTTPDLTWVNDSTFIMVDEDVTIGMEVYNRKHSIIASFSEYGTIEIRKTTALCGDTITVSHTMNTDTVRFAGYTTTPDLTWVNDSTFIMVDEDVTIGMEVYRKRSIIASVSEYGTIEIRKATALCGDTITVSHTMNSGFAFVRCTSTSNLTWLTTSTFIMPYEDVTIGIEAMPSNELPFYEGFEYGNTQDENIVGWMQQSESGYDSWTANSTQTAGNLTPYSGSWNATLFSGNTDWLFTPVNLVKGERYVFSVYARQNDSNASYANISARIGTAADKDSMKQVVAETGVVSGDYQRIVGSFTADTSDVRWLGIKGYILKTCGYLVIDSVSVEKAKSHKITTDKDNKYGTINVKNSALCGDTIIVSHAMNSDTVCFADYITTPDLTWLNDSTFIMVDEDVTIGMGIYRKHSIVASASEYGTIAIKKDTAFCGDTITVSLALNTGFALGGYTTTPDLRWLNDSTFIMVDEDVTIGIKASNIHDIPFCDDFENGNTQGQNIVGWLQQSEYGNYSWTANGTLTSWIRPYSGSWNATLFWSNTCWLFTPVNLVKGTKYVFSIYARQNESNASYANITAKIGTAAEKDSMKQVVVAETGIVDGDYQRIESSFIAGTSGVCWLGIRGYIDNFYSYFLSIDSVSLVKFGLPITIVESENGSVAIANGPAQEDDVVKLAITPEVGYTLDEIIISQNGDKVAFNAEDSTFVMPADSVEISATFKKIDYTILVNESENGTVTTNATAQIDDVVKLAITPATGYTLDEITISQNGDMLTFNAEDSTFVMPADSVEISATFKKVDYTILVKEPENGTVTSSDDIAQIDDVVKLTITSATGYTLDEITISQNGDKLAFNAEDSTFVMLAGDVEISATFKKIDYTILVHESVNGTVTTNATAQMDDNVKLTITPAIGYTLGEITILQNGDKLAFNTEDSTFVMPADSVEISATFTKDDYTILVKESENGTVASSDDIAQIDDIVKLNITSATGYTLDEITISHNGDMVTFNAEDSTFVMPGGNVEISATFKKIDYTILVHESENGTVTTNATAQMDDNVKLTITPTIGYTLDEITILQNGDMLTFNAEDSTFVMPADSVEISATFTKVDYTILVKEPENGTVTSSVAIAQIDDVVKLNITSVTGYTLDEITISHNGEMVMFNAEDSTFVMPGGNVEISATFKKIDYSIHVSETENGSVQVNATAQMDDFVELSITPATGYIVDEISILHNGEAVEYNAKFGLFVMPAGDVTITVTFKQSTDVEEVKVLNLYVADGRIYCEGEFRIYDLLGRDVTAMNGSLRGVYVVRTKDAFQKTIVK